MENTITYTMDDGTEYRLTYDNETDGGRQMHYLLHENGVLKLECKHHALPVELTEEEFKSTLVPGAFFNCIGRNITVKAQRELLRSSGDANLAQLAEFVRPHVTLTAEAEEWLDTVVDRGHSVEIALQLAREAEVERFARELNAEPPAPILSADFAEVKRPGFLSAYWRPVVWSLAVVLVVALAIFFETR